MSYYNSRNSRHSPTNHALILLGGAALGAVATYLLDPDTGARRRKQIADATNTGARSTRDALHPAWDRVADAARAVGSHVTSGASTVGQTLSEKYAAVRDSHLPHEAASHLSDVARSILGGVENAASSASDRVSAALHGTQDYATDSVQRAKTWLHGEEKPDHTAAYAATGVGTLLVGAGLLYALDPTHGADRRARLTAEATNAVQKTGALFRRIGNDLRSRLNGSSAEVESAGTEDALSPERLLHAVRAEISNTLGSVHGVQVMTDNHGRVTLHGNAPIDQTDLLVSAVESVSGVTEVINLITAEATPTTTL